MDTLYAEKLNIFTCSSYVHSSSWMEFNEFMRKYTHLKLSFQVYP